MLYTLQVQQNVQLFKNLERSLNVCKPQFDIVELKKKKKSCFCKSQPITRNHIDNRLVIYYFISKTHLSVSLL